MDSTRLERNAYIYSEMQLTYTDSYRQPFRPGYSFLLLLFHAHTHIVNAPHVRCHLRKVHIVRMV